MSEHTEQKALFQWASIHPQKSLFERRLFAIPNQGGSGWNGKLRGMRMKEEGLKADTADIFFAHPRFFVGGDIYAGLFIEMKDYGKYLTKGQKEFILEMREAEYMAFGVRGWERASQLIEMYLDDISLLERITEPEDLYFGGSGRL